MPNESSILEWLEENQYRAYPLQAVGQRGFQTALSLDSLILDAQLLFHGTANNRQLPAEVKLESIVVAGSQLTLTVTNQPSFSFNRTGASYPMYLRNSNNSLLVVSSVADTITVDAAFTDVKFEDCVCTPVFGLNAGVQSLTLQRSGDSLAAGDRTSSISIVTLEGLIELKEGRQFDIQLQGQTLKLGAGRNFGVPIGCGDWFTDLGVEDNCGDLVSSINGVRPEASPGPIFLKGGQHIKIFSDPEFHRIYIGLDFDAEDVCNVVKTQPLINLK